MQTFSFFFLVGYSLGGGPGSGFRLKPVQTSNLCDQPFKKKKKKVSTTMKVSLWFNNRHTLGPYSGLNQSEIVKGDIPVRMCVCTFENACAAAVRERGE